MTVEGDPSPSFSGRFLQLLALAPRPNLSVQQPPDEHLRSTEVEDGCRAWA